jgi:hypothetical protein
MEDELRGLGEMIVLTIYEEPGAEEVVSLPPDPKRKGNGRRPLIAPIISIDGTLP